MKYCDKCGAPELDFKSSDMAGCRTLDDYKRVAMSHWELLTAIAMEVGFPEGGMASELPQFIKDKP